jgi:hypothetical protein
MNNNVLQRMLGTMIKYIYLHVKEHTAYNFSESSCRNLMTSASEIAAALGQAATKLETGSGNHICQRFPSTS